MNGGERAAIVEQPRMLRGERPHTFQVSLTVVSVVLSGAARETIRALARADVRTPLGRGPGWQRAIASSLLLFDQDGVPPNAADYTTASNTGHRGAWH